MRRFGIAVAVLLMAACSSSSSSSSKEPPTTQPDIASSVPTPAGLRVATVSATARQTIQGFGASGAWWPIDLVHFPADVRQQVADMLFSSDGIALSGYRYNIGGGGKGVTTPDRAPKQYPDDDAGRMFLGFAND